MEHEPLVEESVKVYCTNPKCWMFFEDGEHALAMGWYWHPTLAREYQGEFPHGGVVSFYTLDAFDCPECGMEGEVV